MLIKNFFDKRYKSSLDLDSSVLDFVERGQIEIQHLGFIRGRDIKNSIIISTEAENLTKQHVQLLIGRVGEGSNLWLEGDYSQVDKKVFEESSNKSTIF